MENDSDYGLMDDGAIDCIAKEFTDAFQAELDKPTL